MTPNTYHEEIPDQDVVDRLERLERRAMTQTMLEKVARAIWEARMQTHGRWPDDGPLDAQTEQVRDWVMDEARAAIQALREPTEEMVNVTPEKLRELAGRSYPFGLDVEHYVRSCREALSQAADEIERLKATSDRHLTEMTQLKLAAMGWTKSSP